MKMKVLILWLSIFCPFCLFGQYLEVGATIGISRYFGELQSGFESSGSHFAYGIMARYNKSPRLAFSVQFIKTILSGDDARQKAVYKDKFNRNLSFQSSLAELSVQAEVNLVKYDIRDDKTAAPYLFAGIAAFYNNPRAELNGQWYDLQPLGTEGQTMEGGSGKYSRFDMAIPIGGGFKFSLGQQINLGFELGYRLTFTDYLDDVSLVYPDVETLRNQNPIAGALSFRTPEILPQQAGNPVGKPRGESGNKDSYLLGSISISINLARKYQLEFDEHFKKFAPDYAPKE